MDTDRGPGGDQREFILDLLRRRQNPWGEEDGPRFGQILVDLEVTVLPSAPFLY